MLANGQAVVAIELLTAAQAADWRVFRGAPGEGYHVPSTVAESEAEAERFQESIGGERGR